jgi:HD-GYP domain-containing protein (c-di-GMP phosphodiesterase class II)
MLNHEDRVIGVLQLINARDAETGELMPFSEEDQKLVEALASQAGIALHNQMLLEEQRQLLESFIQVIAAAIDAKSRHTGGHCKRVPVLAEMLLDAACEAKDGAVASFEMTDEERYEFRIAAWLHDCGKVTTPVHVMDKSTKLETIFDRIAIVRERFEVLRRDAELAYIRRLHGGEGDPTQAWTLYQGELRALDDDMAFLERANVGGEFLAEADQERIRAIAGKTYRRGDQECPLLTADELQNLLVRRGTLTDEERVIINGHMVQTIRMLESLPFPRSLRRIPEYAGGHHETMDGRGYPKGVHAGELSIPARIMTIADVFEALTAKDRPYKPGKKLSEAMRIMGEMKRHNQLDPDIFDLFVTSGVYRAYGDYYLPPEQIDDVDEGALLAIVPKPFAVPPEAERRARWRAFLPEYEDQEHRSVRPPEVSLRPEWLRREGR